MSNSTIRCDPMLPLELDRLPKLVAQIEADWIRSHHLLRRRNALIVGAGLLGLRCIEITRLRRSNLDASAHLLRTATAKKGVTRMLYVPETWSVAAAENFSAYHLHHGPRVWLFTSTRGKRLNVSMIRKIVAACTLKALGYAASPHQLRHTAAVICWQQTKDLTAVQRLLGHRHMRSTEMYLQTLTPPDSTNAIDWSRQQERPHLILFPGA